MNNIKKISGKKLSITVYCYDHINNPRCGGGGALREFTVHKLLSSKHNIRLYCGNFIGAKEIKEKNFIVKFLGCKKNYILSRISFSVLATIHSLFSSSDIIAIPYSIFSPVLTFLFKPQKTVILFFHITGKEVFKKYNIFGIFPWIFEKIALYFGKNYITLTQNMAQNIASKRTNVKIVAGYVGFDNTLLTESFEDKNFILYFGRIDVRMKGIDILISAFEKIAPQNIEHKLIIAGRGKESNINWVERRINNSSYFNKIQLIVNPDDKLKKELLSTCSFVCLPSRYEGWNITAIEASACSKAVIGTKIHGLMDAIKDEETGILVESENVFELAYKMQLLIDNLELRKTLGRNGYKWAQNFTWEKVSDIQNKFYLEVNENTGK